MIKYISIKILLIASSLIFLITACKKDYPQNVDSSDGVLIESIKIVNVGVAGNKIVEGVIDETKKTISFPRIDTLTNFKNIKFEAIMSDGAKLENESYSFDFDPGSSSKTNVIKVVNNKRFREYFATLRLDIPVFGADFSKPQIYDYSNNSIGNPIYPDFTSQLTRWTGFDGENVLIVTRTSSAPHILKVSDLKQNIIKKISLNLTGVSGGTYVYSSGAQINGHTYVCNLAAAPPLKIYHWSDPTKAPEIIGQIAFNTIPTIGSRYGDNMSMNLDENGNGYMFFGDNNGGAVNPRDILRIKVSNYTTLSEARSITAQSSTTAWMTMTNIHGSGDYITTGYAAPISLVNESGVLSYALSNSAVPIYGADARIFSFNGERYMIMTGAARDANGATVLFVYDLTQGATTKEALEIFNNKADKTELYRFPLLGSANAAPGTQSGWYIVKDSDGKDEKLTLYAASTDAGFAIIDFPKKKQED